MCRSPAVQRLSGSRPTARRRSSARRVRTPRMTFPPRVTPLSFLVKIGTYDNEQGGQPTRAQAIARAERFDVITAGAHQYRWNVAAMRAANPNLVLRTYVNGTHTRDAGLPEAQYCHDQAGRRITSNGLWAGNILMDPANSGWRTTLLAEVNDVLRRPGTTACSSMCWVAARSSTTSPDTASTHELGARTRPPPGSGTPRSSLDRSKSAVRVPWSRTARLAGSSTSPRLLPPSSRSTPTEGWPRDSRATGRSSRATTRSHSS